MIEKYRNERRHGLVVNVQGATESRMKKVAEDIFSKGLCDEKVETILEYHGNWILVWPKGVSVQMPFIIQSLSGFGTGFWAVETLENYLKS